VTRCETKSSLHLGAHSRQLHFQPSTTLNRLFPHQQAGLLCQHQSHPDIRLLPPHIPRASSTPVPSKPVFGSCSSYC
jgi:hypothetical protein